MGEMGVVCCVFGVFYLMMGARFVVAVATAGLSTHNAGESLYTTAKTA